MLYLLLGILTVLGYLIYQKISELVNQLPNKKPIDSVHSMTSEEWLKSIQYRLYDVERHIESINNALNYENPVGKNSFKQKRIDSIIKIYAQYLIRKDKIDESGAQIRAKYEVYEFGVDKIIEIIDKDYWYGEYENEKRKAEKEFEKSGIVEKDASNFYYWTVEVDGKKQISPYYLAEPMYALLIGDGAHNGDLVHEDIFNKNIENYGDLVKYVAILQQLEKVKILEKTDKKYILNGKSQYKILVDNFEQVKSILYGNETSHDNSDFEEKYQQKELNNFLDTA